MYTLSRALFSPFLKYKDISQGVISVICWNIKIIAYYCSSYDWFGCLSVFLSFGLMMCSLCDCNWFLHKGFFFLFCVLCFMKYSFQIVHCRICCGITEFGVFLTFFFYPTLFLPIWQVKRIKSLAIAIKTKELVYISFSSFFRFVFSFY